MITLVDNFDSFVYNLARYFEELGEKTNVVRNDEVTVKELAASQPDAIVLSPGPCDPERAGISVDLIRQLGDRIPILGVCLGHQAIGVAYGGQVIRARPLHGRTSEIHHDGQGLFDQLPNPLTAARYHSLVVDEASLPSDLEITARTSDGLIMGLQHRRHQVHGVQFHPESVLTESGHQLLANFLERIRHGETHPSPLSESA